ncbi:MAG TPA: hypothetical protein VEK79_15860 [Thermoanaerobaculia bacterium]|nr:hypothetical protein [Thermoanaerobaculia bacterium]
MKSRRAKKWLIGTGAVGVIAVIAWIGFKRQYVIPAAGLLDVTAVAGPRDVVVSGVLLSSMSHVTKTTTDRYADGVIVRVYVELIPVDGTSLASLTRTFTAAVPRSRDARVIYVGDARERETVGSLYGLPVRVPRRDESAARVVWRERN